MAITGVNNDTSYANYYTGTKPKDRSENAKNTTEQQTAEKTYSNTREYRNYLTEKYNCLKSTAYSVEINSSLLPKALGDEKTSEWLEYNLSLIPKVFDNLKSAAATCGSKILSCNISVNGYDDITTEMVGRFEADPGTEKAREELKEKLKKIREEKKEEEKKAEERRQEDEKLEELQPDKNIKLPFDSGIVISDNMMRRNGFDQKI
ncbi:MAG: hypothetical protein K2N95_04630 [Lachnospiraceae bacterium]|nr:hypothetical protein [Lachnospiraceae bacterium]